MSNRVGMQDQIDSMDNASFFRRNEIYSGYENPEYIGAAPYTSEINWYNSSWRKDSDNLSNTHTPKKESASNNRPSTPKKAQIKDSTEEVNNGCFGKNFDVFSDETSFHGLKHIKGGNNWSRRLSWIIILVLALAGLSYQINRSVTKYFDYPTNTNLDYITKSSIEFPKVTVCNINMFKFDEVTPLMGGYAMFFFTGLQYLRSLTPDVGITANGNGYGELTETSYPGEKNLQQFIKYNAHRMKDMLKMCIFNGMECSADNFTLTFTNYGACYVFNPTSKTALQNAGQSYGLSMILNVEHLQYITAPRENVGFRIAIDDRNDIPDLQASGVDVGTGMRASIGLRKQTMTSLPAPYGTCIDEGDKELKYLVNSTYTQSRCFLECETDYFMEICGCRTYYTPGGVDQPFCSPANLTGCYLPNYESFCSRRVEVCGCEEACEVQNFMKTNSFSGFPSRGVPETFWVTGQYEYYALALGFKIKQKMEATRNHVSFILLESVEGLVTETAIELNMPEITVDLPHDEYLYQLNVEFIIFCYDLTFYLVQEIADNIFYDVTAVFEEENSTLITGVGSEFYNQTLEKADDQLSNQIESILETMETTYPNATEEDRIFFIDVLKAKLYKIVYPQLWDPSFGFGIEIYTTSDMVYVTRDYMVDNYARIDIYYESLNVEVIEKQKAYEFFSIVCDLGGALGLFFGASLVAFVEAIDFWLIRGCCGPKKK